MAKSDKAPIVIKKITIAGGGGHGGAWKVAFADFMTAMMCFFLVMWLLNQTPEVKKQVASYFSGPSMLENQMTSYGAELTLEKLFLDLVNEPLKAAQTFMQPADFTPNLMAMGSKKIVMAEIAQQLGEYAQDVKIESNNFSFDIEDKYLFVEGTADPAPTFVDIMERVKALTVGLEDSRLIIDSHLYVESVADESVVTAKRVAEERLALIRTKVKTSLEHDTVDISGSAKIAHARKMPHTGRPGGRIKFTVEQKEILSNGRKPRPLEEAFGKSKADMPVYDDFVRRMSEKPKKSSSRK